MFKYTILALLLFAYSLPLNGMKRKRNNDDQKSKIIPAAKKVKNNNDLEPENNNNRNQLPNSQDSIELQLDQARELIELTQAKSLDTLNAIAQIVINTIQRTPDLNENIEIQEIIKKLLIAIEAKNDLATIKNYLNNLSGIADINQYLDRTDIAKIMVMNLDYNRNVGFISKLIHTISIPNKETLTHYSEAMKNLTLPLQYIVNIPSIAVQNAFKTTKALLFFAGAPKVCAPMIKWAGKFGAKKALNYVSENKLEAGVSLASTAAYAYFGTPALLILVALKFAWYSLGFKSLTAYGAFERDAENIKNKLQEELQRNTPHNFSTLDLCKHNLTELTLDTVGKQCFATNPMPLTLETQLILTQELLKHVNVINLSGNYLTSNADCLSGLSICATLTFLCLADNNLTSLEFIESIMQIKILDISNNEIDFGDASNLGALCTQKELIKLIVFNTKYPEFSLSDDAVSALVTECPILVHENIYACQEQYAKNWRGTKIEMEGLEDTKEAALKKKQKKVGKNESDNEQQEISAIIEEVQSYLKNDQASLYDYINTLSSVKISKDSNHANIKKVCRALLLKYHPDKLQALDAQEVEAKENIFKLMNKVITIILNNEKRALYDKMLNNQ